MTLSTYLILYNNFTKVSFSLLAFVFFSCLLVYNLTVFWYGKKGTGISGREQWKIDHQRLLRLLSLFAGMGVLAASCFLPLRMIFFLMHLGLLSMFYVVPVRFRGRRYSIRNIPLVKIFTLAYVWTAVTAGLPAIHSNVALDHKIILLFADRFLFIFALSIPFDIRDYQKDRAEGLLTIPGWIGIDEARMLAKILLLLFVAISVLINHLSYISLSCIICAFIAWVLIGRSDAHRHDFFYMIGIDGLLILHFLVLTLLNSFL